MSNPIRLSLIALPLIAACGLAQAATNVGVSVSVNQPGVYGRIDIGNTPPPVIYAQPVIIERRTVQAQPIYLRVPPGHERNWRKHCREYGACGQPVYFVRDGGGSRHDRDEDRDEGRYEDRGDDHPGRGHGHGHGKH